VTDKIGGRVDLERSVILIRANEGNRSRTGVIVERLARRTDSRRLGIHVILKRRIEKRLTKWSVHI